MGCAVLGLASASQLPEFSQQYRQRLNGALEELRVVVTDFDSDAKNSGMSRDDALNQLLSSNGPFPKDRGKSMTQTIERFDSLEQQKISMDKVEPVSRPLFMLQSPDEKIMRGTWEIFEPAVPLNLPGLLWGGFGALILALIARIPISLTRGIRRRRSERALAANIQTKSVPINNLNVETAPNDATETVRGFSSSRSPENGPQSLLDQLPLEQKMIGEVDANGRLKPAKR